VFGRGRGSDAFGVRRHQCGAFVHHPRRPRDRPGGRRPRRGAERLRRAARSELLADPALTLVERATVGRVLKEQELQAAFGPQGVGQRVKIGAVLKADLLVLVRPGKESKEPVLDVAVSETAGGVRLLHRVVPAGSGTEGTEGTVAALRTAVDDGVRKYRETVKLVVAVPPFVSRDLGFETDHLKAAFARLAVAAADGPGVVAVELAEAEAVAAELRLAAPGANVTRPLPTYLLGEFRHAGAGSDRTVTLTLRVERGGKPVGEPTQQTVAVDQAPAAIRAWAAAAVGVPNAAAAPIDPNVEAKQLAARADEFRRLGDWDESLALAEASLLLDPSQTDMHAVALKALCPPLRQAWIRSFEPGNPEQFERLYLRGLRHLEPLFVTGSVGKYRDASGGDLVMDFRGAANHLGGLNGGAKGDAADRLESARAADRAMALRILPHAAKQDSNDARVIVGWAVQHLPVKERCERLGEIVFALSDLPGARSRTVSFVCRGYTTPPEAGTPEYQALIDRLEKSDKAELRAAAGDLVKLVENAKAAPPFKHSTIDPPAPTAPGPDGIAFAPIELKTGATGVPPRPVALAQTMLSGVVPAGEGTDVFWSRTSLFLMREKGTLQRVWEAVGNHGIFGLSSVSFDGRYVWASLPRHQKAPTLLVLDPQTGTVFDLSAAEGLPQPPSAEIDAKYAKPALIAAPVAPGRACVIGGVFGRSWVAVVEFDPKSGKGTAKVIHEAREASDRTNTEQWKATAVAFEPTFAYTVRNPAGTGVRVLVGRGGGANLSVWDHPLVIDPDRPGVGVVQGRVWAWPSQWACAQSGDAVLFVEPLLSPDGKRALVRLSYPDGAKQVIAQGMPYSDGQYNRAVVHDGRVHMVLPQSSIERTDKSNVSTANNTRHVRIDQWWVADTSGANLRRVATGLKPISGLGSSTHYGLIAFLGRGNGLDPSGTPHTVTFPPAAFQGKPPEPGRTP
jgi:hypothetical protein